MLFCSKLKKRQTITIHKCQINLPRTNCINFIKRFTPRMRHTLKRGGWPPSGGAVCVNVQRRTASCKNACVWKHDKRLQVLYICCVMFPPIFAADVAVEQSAWGFQFRRPWFFWYFFNQVKKYEERKKYIVIEHKSITLSLNCNCLLDLIFYAFLMSLACKTIIIFYKCKIIRLQVI